MAQLCVNINELCRFHDCKQIICDLQRFGNEGIAFSKGGIVLPENLKCDNQHVILESTLSEDLIDYVADNHVDTVIITDLFGSCFFEDVIKKIIADLKGKGIKVSALVSAEADMLKSVSAYGFDAITLDCERYLVERQGVINDFREISGAAKDLGYSVSASRGLNLKNLKYFIDNVRDIEEVIIEREFVSDALYFGIGNTVQLYRRCLTC